MHFPKQNISGLLEQFILHHGLEKFSNYISVSLEYGDFGKLWKDLSEDIRGLKNRGEAHVTVITPVEYDEALKTKLSIEELDQMAQDLRIQESQLKLICLGKGEKIGVGQTYFVVLESEPLIDFRKKVLVSFLKKGGSPGQFDPEHFYPHITVGFSLRDLHESDGVIKDKNSCFKKLVFKK